jgi:hypothetical protein
MIHTFTVWAEHGCAASLPPETLMHHHILGDLLDGDYLLVTTETALALYEARQLDLVTFGLLNEDVQRDVRDYMRRQIEAKRRGGQGEGVGT